MKYGNVTTLKLPLFIMNRKTKMIGIVATLKIQEGKNSEFESIANQLVEKVNANEEGVVYYDLYKQDDTTYVFLERYKDQAAFDLHQKTDYYKALGAKLGSVLAGAPNIKILKSV
jgi:quinol monooxygenase YgiN